MDWFNIPKGHVNSSCLEQFNFIRVCILREFGKLNFWLIFNKTEIIQVNKNKYII